MISDTDKAYIAGLFDGEGSINFTRKPEKKKKHKGPGHRILLPSRTPNIGECDSFYQHGQP